MTLWLGGQVLCAALVTEEKVLMDISSPVRKADAFEKSRATARYIADMEFEGLL